MPKGKFDALREDLMEKEDGVPEPEEVGGDDADLYEDLGEEEEEEEE